jgi:hypothetical protein
VQTGTLLLVSNTGFTFQPDGTPSPDGSRVLAWDTDEWADCDDQGNNCNWVEGVRPRCIHGGAHVKIATVNVNYGGWSKERLLWMKCLDASTTFG